MTDPLQMPLSSYSICVIDTETTSLMPESAGLCELAALRLHSSGAYDVVANTLVDPGMPIPPEAMAVHHITNGMVRGYPRFAQVIDLVTHEHVYAAHNAHFDATVLGLMDRTWIDTERMAKHLMPDAVSHGLWSLYYQYVPGAAVDLGKTHPHRALHDAQACAILLHLMIPMAQERWSIATVGQLIEHISKPAILARLPFKRSNGQLFEHAATDHLHWIIRTGAGGSDCVHTASHHLQLRYGPTEDCYQEQETY